ncbi:VOC family protein [Streptomyces sp. HPF1205]|uniref:VOC family protein n=1 Tax=Streptomyces sp. HPF1205 TaxID=2873262 RepID=UPI001CED33A3|nr:VOC family protein [Streptomyces sp. HPF1205]
MAITHITLLSVPVTDQEAAKSFYEKLGFKVINDHEMTPEEMPPEPGLRWLQLATPEEGCSIVLVTWDVGGLKPGTQQFSIAAQDVKGTHEALAAKGVESNGPLMEAPWGHFFSVNDPDGNHILVVQEPGTD